ncbi:protein of unknown function [Enterobacter cancerogenus]|nr:protein of unknown function [Enterobacter cancerogenus]
MHNKKSVLEIGLTRHKQKSLWYVSDIVKKYYRRIEKPPGLWLSIYPKTTQPKESA